MPGVATTLGPILDLMTWVCLVPGIPLLVIARITSKRRRAWSTATAEVFEAGGDKVFRWSDSGGTPRLSLHSPEETRGLEPGHEIVLYYDPRHPHHWSLGPPRHDNPYLILGRILTAFGAVCLLAGFILMTF